MIWKITFELGFEGFRKLELRTKGFLNEKEVGSQHQERRVWGTRTVAA